MSTARLLIGDVFEQLATLEDASVDFVMTSPPFLALRSYLPADHESKHLEIGSEATPGEFIDTLLDITEVTTTTTGGEMAKRGSVVPHQRRGSRDGRTPMPHGWRGLLTPRVRSWSIDRTETAHPHTALM